MYTRTYLFLLISLLFGQSILAQSIDLISNSNLKIFDIEEVVLPKLNNEALMAEEENKRGPGLAPKFAVPVAVDLSPSSSGTWEILNDKAIWRLRISSKDAKSLNLGFTRYKMPESGSLIIYSMDRSKVVGPFSSQDNEVHNQLWTPIIQSDEVVVEVSVAIEDRDELSLHIGSVNHDFMGFGSFASGSCNLDVICGFDEGWDIVDQYRDIIRSVAVIATGGGTFCTGFLINNANNDGKPFFMTAAHCGISAANAASLVTYWNFENSTCRDPGSAASGGNGNGQLNIFNTGSTYRAGWATSDFTLVELDDPVNPDASGFLAGYSLDLAVSQDTTIGIHHPSTDEKRISFEFDPTNIGVWPGNNNNPNGNHVIVPDWDIGTTEGGSSGSPLFDKNKRVIGQLHGGAAACGNDSYDSYGWFVSSWEGGGTPSTRLKDWLDPNNIGGTGIDGLDLDFSIVSQPSARTICLPEDATFSITISENFEAPVDLVLDPMPSNGVTATFSANPVTPGETVVLTFSNTAGLSAGNNAFSINGTDGTNGVFSTIVISALDGAPMAPSLEFPMDQATEVQTNAVLEWASISSAELYDLQIARDANFVDIVDNITDLAENSFVSSSLGTVTEYFWRVRGSNQCGVGDWTSTNSFTTSAILCKSSAYEGGEITIGEAPVVIESSLNIASSGFIDEIVVANLEIQHTYIGDLKVTLISPSGTEVILVDRIGVPAAQFGCGEDNFFLTFDDFSVNTAQDLEDACPPAFGNYQPVESLSAFLGEDPNGDWRLVIEDEADGDGGAFIGFSLQICSSIPNDTGLTSQANDLPLCQEGETSFGLIVGVAYAGPVTITPSGVPASMQFSYSSNPADPGSVIEVTIDAGNTPLGDYTIVWIGDDGTNIGEGTTTLSIIDSPTDFTLSDPMDGAIDVPQVVNFNWAASTAADTYLIEVFERGTTTVAESETVSTESATITLDIGGKYDWTVTAINDCGERLSSNTWSLDVIGDLSFNNTSNGEQACLEEAVDVSINIGAGYFEPAVVDFSINGNPAITTSFDQDLNNVTPGSTLNGTITFAVGNDFGNYPINFTIDDGTHNSQTQLTVELLDSVGTFALLAPDNNTSVGTLRPTLDWGNSTNSDNFLLEISDDMDFSNVVLSQTLSISFFQPTSNLEPGTTYYWRVTANGGCNNFTPPVFSFTTETSGTINLEGSEATILPNPFSNFVEIWIENLDASSNVTWSLVSVEGKRLQNGIVNQRTTRIDTQDLPAGIYFVKLNNGTTIATDKIIKF